MDRGAWLVGYSPWGHKESDMTEWLNFSLSFTLKIPSIDTPWTDNRHSTTCQAQVLIFVHNNYYSPFKEIDIKAQRDFIIWPSLWVNKCMSWGADTITSKPESDTQKEELPGAVLSWLPHIFSPFLWPYRHFYSLASLLNHLPYSSAIHGITPIFSFSFLMSVFLNYRIHTSSKNAIA